MGMLKRDNGKNILTQYGFTFKERNVNGKLDNCYEKAITLSALYCAWVAVNIETSDVYIYVEYECGGEVSTFDFTLEHNFYDGQEAFFNELDEEVTDYVNSFE